MHVYINNNEDEEMVWFAPNQGVTVKPAILKESPDLVTQIIEAAFQWNKNEHLIDCCCGGRGPLMDRFGYGVAVSMGDFRKALEEIRIEEETKKAKRRISKQRRSEFQRERGLLALRLIDRGVMYVCAWDGCRKSDNLTLDHIEPLSRGGTDGLDNLQFLCNSHNSQKGDRRVAGVRV